MSQTVRPIVTPLLALAAGPAAWATQLIAGYGASSLACFPHDAPAAAAPGPGEHAALIVLNLACLALALSGTVLAYQGWRRAGPERPAEHNDEMPARLGRARFLGACGIVSGMIFSLAILFDTPAILTLPTCWSGL